MSACTPGLASLPWGESKQAHCGVHEPPLSYAPLERLVPMLGAEVGARR